MKRKNGFTIIFLLPLVVLAIVVLGVIAFKLYSDNQKQQAILQTPKVEKVTPGLQKEVKKPAVGYGTVPVPVVQNVTAPDMSLVEPASSQASVELDSLIQQDDDAGENELKALDASASGL